MMQADIEKGLKPGEALQVIIGPADKDRYNIHNRRSITRFIQKYVRARELPYSVKSFERRTTGEFFFLVGHISVPQRKRA
jgi:hypothetical protein